MQTAHGQTRSIQQALNFCNLCQELITNAVISGCMHMLSHIFIPQRLSKQTGAVCVTNCVRKRIRCLFTQYYVQNRHN